MDKTLVDGDGRLAVDDIDNGRPAEPAPSGKQSGRLGINGNRECYRLKPKLVVFKGVNESVWCEMDNASPGVVEEREARGSPV